MVPGPDMVPSVQVKSPLTSSVSDPVRTPRSPPAVRFRLAMVIVAPVLKLMTPESIVRLPSGLDVTARGEDDVGAVAAPGVDQGRAADVVRAARGEVGRNARAERDRARAADIRGGVEGVRLVIKVVSEEEGRAGVNVKPALTASAFHGQTPPPPSCNVPEATSTVARVDEIGLHQGRGRAVGHGDGAVVFKRARRCRACQSALQVPPASISRVAPE